MVETGWRTKSERHSFGLRVGVLEMIANHGDKKSTTHVNLSIRNQERGDIKFSHTRTWVLYWVRPFYLLEPLVEGVYQIFFFLLTPPLPPSYRRSCAPPRWQVLLKTPSQGVGGISCAKSQRRTFLLKMRTIPPAFFVTLPKSYVSCKSCLLKSMPQDPQTCCQDPCKI